MIIYTKKKLFSGAKSAENSEMYFFKKRGNMKLTECTFSVESSRERVGSQLVESPSHFVEFENLSPNSVSWALPGDLFSPRRPCLQDWSWGKNIPFFFDFFHTIFTEYFIERCSTLAVGGRGKLHKAIPAKKSMEKVKMVF